MDQTKTLTPKIEASNDKSKLAGSFELFPKSVEIVRRNLKMFGLLYLLPLIAVIPRIFSYHKDYIGSSGMFSGLSGIPTYGLVGFAALGVVFVALIFIVATVVHAMTIGLQLESAEGKVPVLKQLWEVGKKYWLRLLGLEIAVGLYIIGGLILLIVPGVIMLRRYFLAPYFLIDKDLSIKQAMARSAAISKPYAGSIWGILGVTVLVSLAGVIPFIGPLIAFSLSVAYSVAPALRYLELKKLHAAS